MKRKTIKIAKNVGLTPDILDIIKERLMESFLKEGTAWELFDVKANFDIGMGKVTLEIRRPIADLRRVLHPLFSEIGEYDNKELKKLLRDPVFHEKRKLYYSLLGKHGRLTEIEANLVEELGKDRQISRYLALRLGNELNGRKKK